MKAAEFLRRVRKLARKNNVSCRFEKGLGKGSHGRLFYGNRLTTLQDLRHELPTGTLRGMLDQLGITYDDFQGR